MALEAFGLKDITKALLALWDKVLDLLHRTPQGALHLTGVLGLAALLVGYYRFRGDGGSGSSSSNSNGGSRQNINSREATAHTQGMFSQQALKSRSVVDNASSSTTSGKRVGGDNQKLTLGQVVRSRLYGLKRITMSVPGVLFIERSAAQLQDGATVRAEALQVLRQMLTFARVYLITQVDGDLGEAVIVGTLEDNDLVGSAPGQIPQHTLLFCSTMGAKVSIVRQLEPDLHIDAEWDTINDLKRFIPQLLHIHGQGRAVTGPNIACGETLEAFFQS